MIKQVNFKWRSQHYWDSKLKTLHPNDIVHLQNKKTKKVIKKKVVSNKNSLTADPSQQIKLSELDYNFTDFYNIIFIEKQYKLF